jgi:hypothetical protein
MVLLLLLLHAASWVHPAASSSSSSAGRGVVSCTQHCWLHRPKVPHLLRRQLVAVQLPCGLLVPLQHLHDRRRAAVLARMQRRQLILAACQHAASAADCTLHLARAREAQHIRCRPCAWSHTQHTALLPCHNRAQCHRKRAVLLVQLLQLLQPRADS